MDQPRRKTSRHTLLVVVLATLIVYPLAFGPVCWCCSYLESRTFERMVNVVYAPVAWGCQRCPRPLLSRIEDYASFASKRRIRIWDARIWLYDQLLPLLQSPEARAIEEKLGYD